jgi:hypothetical protein
LLARKIPVLKATRHSKTLNLTDRQLLDFISRSQKMSPFNELVALVGQGTNMPIGQETVRTSYETPQNPSLFLGAIELARSGCGGLGARFSPT